MVILGIDPGLQGAIAMVERRGSRCFVDVRDMPISKLTVAGKSRSRVDMAALQDIVEDWAALADAAIVEDLSGRPSTVVGRNGARVAQKGLWEQGWNCAAPVQALVAARLPYALVTPSVWKRRLKVPADKKGAKLAADRLFPEFRSLWKLAKHDGRAEAALLAQYHFEVQS